MSSQAEDYYQKVLTDEAPDPLFLQVIRLRQIWQSLVEENRVGIACVKLAQGDKQSALTYAQQAYANIVHEENRVGIACVKLAQGDKQSALTYAQQAYANIVHEDMNLDWAIEPLGMFRFLWEVLMRLNQTEDADAILRLAIQRIEDYLNKNPDPDLVAMYLGQPHQQVLWQAWVAKKDDKGKVEA